MSGTASTQPLSAQASAPAGLRVLLSDPFDDPANGSLPRRSTNTVQTDYVDGEYSIKNTSPNDEWQGTGHVTTPNDIIVSVDARVLNPVDQRFITVGCRYKIISSGPVPSSSYRLIVYPWTRQFALTRIEPSGSTPLISRRSSAAIHANDEWNHLELSCLGNSIVARINGQELGSVQDATLTDGGFIINIGGPNAMPRAEARLDNLVIYGP